MDKAADAIYTSAPPVGFLSFSNGGAISMPAGFSVL